MELSINCFCESFAGGEREFSVMECVSASLGSIKLEGKKLGSSTPSEVPIAIPEFHSRIDFQSMRFLTSGEGTSAVSLFLFGLDGSNREG